MKAKNPIFIHYVHDMVRARAFYSTVFGVSASFESPGWSTLDFGAFELALHILVPGHDEENVMPHAGLNLEVENIEDMQARIERSGGKLVWLREAEPRVPARVASFEDSEGNRFELRQPVVS